MRTQKAFIFSLLIFGLAISGYFSFLLVETLFEYYPLKKQAETRISRWEIKEMEGSFALKAFYSFETQGKIWNGTTLLSKPWYLNEPSALLALKGKAKEEWLAWFNPKNPEHSSLEKVFPIGLLVRVLICYGVFIYFSFI